MSLPVTALLERSLRCESRSIRTYVVRLALLLFTFAAFVNAKRGAGVVGARGLTFFRSVVLVDFFFITLAGLAHFASAIAEEKEERTLGLLRMTSLSPLAMLLGKSTARTVTVLTLLLAQFPFTAVAVGLGGVSLRQVIAAYCALLAYVVLYSNMALFWSVVFPRVGSAAAMTAATLAFFFITPLAGASILSMAAELDLVRGAGWLATALAGGLDLMARAACYHQLGRIMDSGFDGTAVGFQVLTNVGLGVVFFLLSWAVFDFFTREARDPTPTRGLVPRSSSRFSWLAAGRSWDRALAWKDFNFVAGGKAAMVLKSWALLLLVGVTASACASAGLDPRDMFGRVVMLICLISIGVELTAYAFLVFQEEAKWRTLPGLAALPMPITRIAYCKVAGCLLHLAPSVALFLVGACLAPDRFVAGVSWLATTPLGRAAFSATACFLHLVAYLSLQSGKRLLALAGVWLRMRDVLLGVMLLVTASAYPALVFTLLTFWLHIRIGKRLREAAMAY